MGIHNPHFYYPSATNESPKQRKYPLANCLDTIHSYHRAIAKPRHIFGSECALATNMERGAAYALRAYKPKRTIHCGCKPYLCRWFCQSVPLDNTQMSAQRLVHIRFLKHQHRRSLRVYDHQSNTPPIDAYTLHRFVYPGLDPYSATFIQKQEREKCMDTAMALCRNILCRQRYTPSFSTPCRTGSGTCRGVVYQREGRIQQSETPRTIHPRRQTDQCRLHACSSNNRRIVQPQPHVRLRI